MRNNNKNVIKVIIKNNKSCLVRVLKVVYYSKITTIFTNMCLRYKLLIYNSNAFFIKLLLLYY